MSCFHHQHNQIHHGSLETPAFSKFISDLGRIPSLAHHPACKYHHNHVIWIGRFPFCLGCLMMSCGMIAGMVLIPRLISFTDLPFSVLIVLGVLLYFPAIIQIWVQKKLYKIIARVCLGVSVILLCYSGLWLTPNSTIGWFFKFGFIIVFSVVWNLTLRLRSRYSKTPCKNCPEGRFPLCAYTTHRIPKLARNYFLESDKTNPEADEFIAALQSLYSHHSG